MTQVKASQPLAVPDFLVCNPCMATGITTGMAEAVKLSGDNRDIPAKAADVLRNGGLVAVPTETVYGLAADACNADAVAKIYAAKGRPSFNPLIAHVTDMKMAERYGVFDENSRALACAFWPGPLTLVVPVVKKSEIAAAVTAGLSTIALRQPVGVMAELARWLDQPIAAPSANSSGRISPTRAQHVADDLGHKVDMILDGGSCTVGLESAIAKCVGGKVVLLRDGGISLAEIEHIVGPVERPVSGEVEAPGMLLKHYAPRKPVRLNAACAEKGEALLGFGEGTETVTLNLSPSGDLKEAAQNLFAMLHKLDNSDSKAIAVQPVPSDGIGAAINDRLRRAEHGSARP